MPAASAIGGVGSGGRCGWPGLGSDAGADVAAEGLRSRCVRKWASGGSRWPSAIAVVGSDWPGCCGLAAMATPGSHTGSTRPHRPQHAENDPRRRRRRGRSRQMRMSSRRRPPYTVLVRDPQRNNRSRQRGQIRLSDRCPDCGSACGTWCGRTGAWCQVAPGVFASGWSP
jgi:hypothetical protein